MLQVYKNQNASFGARCSVALTLFAKVKIEKVLKKAKKKKKMENCILRLHAGHRQASGIEENKN